MRNDTEPVYRRTASPDRTWWGFGAVFTWLATAEDTAGQLALADVRTRRGLEPPPHTHSHEDEAYFIIEGRVTATVGGETFGAGPGDLVWLPREIEHGFTVDSDVVHHLVLLSPAGLEKAFLALSEPAEAPELPPEPDGPPGEDEIRQLTEVFGSAGIRFAGPPT